MHTDKCPAARIQLTNNGRLLRVGALARATGKTVRAIHLYEELGLLRSRTRSSGGFRPYSEGAVDRMRWIDLLHGFGFSLPEMRGLLEKGRERARDGAGRALARRALHGVPDPVAIPGPLRPQDLAPDLVAEPDPFC